MYITLITFIKRIQNVNVKNKIQILNYHSDLSLGWSEIWSKIFLGEVLEIRKIRIKYWLRFLYLMSNICTARRRLGRYNFLRSLFAHELFHGDNTSCTCREIHPPFGANKVSKKISFSFHSFFAKTLPIKHPKTSEHVSQVLINYYLSRTETS